MFFLNFLPFLVAIIFFFLRFSIRTTPRDVRDNDVSVVTNLECILSDSQQIFAASSAANPVRKLPDACPSLKLSLEEVAAPISRVDADDTIDGLANRHLSK